MTLPDWVVAAGVLVIALLWTLLSSLDDEQ